jgi:phosphonate transport system permease protein
MATETLEGTQGKTSTTHRKLKVGADTPEYRESLLSPWPRISALTILEFLIAIIIIIWGFNGTDVRVGEFLEGLDNIARFIIRLFPAKLDWVQVPIIPSGVGNSLTTLKLFGLDLLGLTFPVPLILIALIETIQMAVIGTLIAIVLSLPFGLLAAQNTAPSRWIYQVTRLVLNVNRAIPNIIFALIFVSAVGLGPFGGVLALGIGSIGFMGKLYAESIEAIDPQQVLAVRATGAGPLQTFMYAVVPQSMPLIASYSLYLFETNVRSASILGLVGAGGVGFQMSKYMALFQYRKLTGALILVITMVTLLDRGSAYLRKRII